MRSDDFAALKEQRRHAIAQAKALSDRAEREKRSLTRDEQRQFDELVRIVEVAGVELGTETDQPPATLTLGGSNGNGLLGEYRAAGWDIGSPAAIGFDRYLASETRATSFSGGVGTMNPLSRQSGPLGADRRFAYRALPTVNVAEDVTSVSVLRQASRSLPTASSVVRAIDAVTAKPNVDSGLELATVNMNQVAAISTNTPRIVAVQDAAAAAVEADLRLAIDSGLDHLTVQAAAGSPHVAPGTDNILVSLRKAISALWAAGYNPDTVVLRPADSEAIDVMVSGISGGTADFVFGAAQFAPGTLFGLDVRVATSAPAPWVFDSQAWARLYATSPRLQTFEADSGTTNRLNIRLEMHAAVVVERTQALRRIAAS